MRVNLRSMRYQKYKQSGIMELRLSQSYKNTRYNNEQTHQLNIVIQLERIKVALKSRIPSASSELDQVVVDIPSTFR